MIKIISLKVTKKVLEYSQTNSNHKQIAVSPSFSGTDKSNMKELIIQGHIKLILGDTSAIWRKHNLHTVRDFDNLFDFLCKYPDVEFQFNCSNYE